MSPLIIIVIVAVIVIGWAVLIYNKFVRLQTQATEAWSDIDVQLKRRYDLIPNLIETVKGYASHEQATFEKVVAARNSAMGAQTVEEHAKAENMLTGALKSIFALSEAYPDLKANQNFLELQRELTDTENKIQASRRFFNSTVRDLNIAVESVPSNLIANMFSLKKKEFFELDADEAEVAKDPVKVSF